MRVLPIDICQLPVGGPHWALNKQPLPADLTEMQRKELSSPWLRLGSGRAWPRTAPWGSHLGQSDFLRGFALSSANQHPYTISAARGGPTV